MTTTSFAQNSSFLIQPRKDLNVANTSVITPSSNSLSRLQSLLANNKDIAIVTETKLPGGVLLKTYPGASLVGPIIGAPQAVLVCESLLASGTKKLLLLSIAGALDPVATNYKIGDIVFPRGAISEDGTSRVYGAQEKELFAVGKLQSKLEEQVSKIVAKELEDITCHTANVWTTDTPYRESLAKIQHYRSLGAEIVDMEFAALLQLCRIYEAELSCTFVVSDLLTPKWQPGFRDKRFKKTLNTITHYLATNLFNHNCE